MSTVNINLSKKMFNDVYLKHDLLHDESRYMVLMGGGGSGKSVFATQKIIYRLLREKGHRVLVLRKVAKTLRESVFTELKRSIYNWGLEKLFTIPTGQSSDLYMRVANGNQILFAGLDDVEKLKSISGVTMIWAEEASELEPEDFRQLDIRLRGKTAHYKQMIITFNPISVTHWLKSEFFDREKEGAFTLHTTYKDNKFLDEENIKVLEGFKDTDPYFYSVYALGEWGVIGKTIFNAQIVTARISALRKRKEQKKGYFTFKYANNETRDKIIDTSIQWVDDENGYITIYDDVKERVPYVIGGDTSGDGSDFFTASVLNNTNGKQVAVFHNQLDEDLYTEQMYCMGKYFNYALIGIEANFSTYPIKSLDRLGYRNQYIRESIDTYTGAVQKKYGFRTDRASRPVIIANLVKVVRESPELIHDIPTLDEMLTFVRNEKGKAEAQEGKHDDLIIALAVAHHIREQQDTVLAAPTVVHHELPFAFRTEEQATDDFINW
jgi:phage terminase large subunit